MYYFLRYLQYANAPEKRRDKLDLPATRAKKKLSVSVGDCARVAVSFPDICSIGLPLYS